MSWPVLKRAMSSRGFAMRAAHVGEQAQAPARQHRPAPGTLDRRPEQASGLKLRPERMEAVRGCRVVVLTGYSSSPTAGEAIKLGAVNYLCKPADADEVLAAFDKEGGDPEAEVAEQPPSINRLAWEHIQKVLQENDGNISATARALGMHRRTLQRKLQKRPVRR